MTRKQYFSIAWTLIVTAIALHAAYLATVGSPINIMQGLLLMGIAAEMGTRRLLDNLQGEAV